MVDPVESPPELGINKSTHPVASSVQSDGSPLAKKPGEMSDFFKPRTAITSPRHIEKRPAVDIVDGNLPAFKKQCVEISNPSDLGRVEPDPLPAVPKPMVRVATISKAILKSSLMTPGPAKSSQSRAMASKSALNDAVQNGSFIRNPAKWSTFKEKLKTLDPNFEVNDTDPTLARRVRHSRCAEYILMACPYDVGRFKEHIKICADKKAKKSAANTRTLDSMFQSNKPKPSKRSSLSTAVNLWPCPGLTEKDARGCRD